MNAIDNVGADSWEDTKGLILNNLQSCKKQKLRDQDDGFPKIFVTKQKAVYRFDIFNKTQPFPAPKKLCWAWLRQFLGKILGSNQFFWVAWVFLVTNKSAPWNAGKIKYSLAKRRLFPKRFSAQFSFKHTKIRETYANSAKHVMYGENSRPKIGFVIIICWKIKMGTRVVNGFPFWGNNDKVHYYYNTFIHCILFIKVK